MNKVAHNLPLNPDVLAHIHGRNAAVAVSGGSDSLALLFLLKEQSNAALTVLTVNHGLREEATSEAEYVAEICKNLELPHRTLNIWVPKAGNLAANARKARYEAMCQFCTERDIPHLVLGHTKDDQFETFLMNALRGSGVDGLAAMSAVSADGFFLRPMLDLRRKDLQNHLHTKQIDYVSDPSNVDATRERVRLRRWLEKGEASGIDLSNLAKTLENIGRAKSYLTNETQRKSRELIHFSALEIEAKIEREKLLREDEEIAFRLLAALCQFYGGSHYKPRLSALKDLRQALRAKKGGRVLEKTEFHWGEKWLRIYAEPQHLPAAQNTVEWSRFSLAPHVQQTLPEAFIAPLNDQSALQQTAKAYGISANAAKGWPAVFAPANPAPQFISAHAKDVLAESFFGGYL